MKKLLLMAVMAIASLTANAQTIGVNLDYATNCTPSSLGIGVKYQHPLSGAWRLEGSGNFYFKKDYTTWWDLNVNAHYLFDLGSNINFYPLAGVGVDTSSVSFGGSSTSHTWFITNIGAGIELPITSSVKLNFELKDQIHFGDGGGSRIVFQLGVGFAI